MARSSSFAAVRLPLLGAAAGLMLALAGCAVTPPPVPPPKAEHIPLPPVSAQALAWQPGHWNWDGQGYNWEPGRYVPAPSAGPHHEWVPGHWAQDAQGAPWRWVPAHWM
jgi:hypothetical protein